MALPVDFSRDVYCILGLPFDAIDVAGTEAHLRRAARDRKPCFLSTPNLNFLVGCRSDSQFRNSVINSDLSIADGMPMVWGARLLGIPIRERVAGSTVFNALRYSRGQKLSVYFFGGLEGVAEVASRQLAIDEGLICVGFESPGFGTVEDMSSDATIARINASRADFLVVALGAKKGQAWIEHNRQKLAIPIISHLGAVLNFVAGTVRQAPSFLQRAGLEWLWRIKEEPALWNRYFWDGSALLALLVTRLLPHVFYQWRNKPLSDGSTAAGIRTTENGPDFVVQANGAWTATNIDALRSAFSEAARSGKNVRLELEKVTFIDCAFVGQITLLYGHLTQHGRRLCIDSPSYPVRRVIRYCCAEYLYLEDA